MITRSVVHAARVQRSVNNAREPRASPIRLTLSIVGLQLVCWQTHLCFADDVWPTRVQIRLDGADVDSPKAYLVVSGLEPNELSALRNSRLSTDQWNALFSVYVQTSGRLPIIGRYAVVDGDLRFTPRFPFRTGIRHQAILELGKMKPNFSPGRITYEFAIPESKTHDPTYVTHVYPSSSVVPENLLKFYIHFSAPMSRGEAYQRIQLLDHKGQPIAYPFLELGEELWDKTATRFTVFFDPGRVKRGLKPREDVGPVLEANRTYTLIVANTWRDAHGRPLKRGYEKQFRTVSLDDEQPRPDRWKITAPLARTRDPLIVTFDEPLDHAMLVRVLTIHRGRTGVSGQIDIGQNETQWRFRPREPWASGSYRLRVDTVLEDMAGNSIGRPFEVDVFDKVEQKSSTEVVELGFEVSPARRSR